MSSRHERLAKYTIPERPPGLLRRPRLLDFLHAHADRKLILVSAAAGYGKTSLLADFAHDTELPVAWCVLDESDRDLANFVTDVIAALQRRFVRFGETTSAVLAELTGRTQGAERLATTLAREIDTSVDDYFVLVLDDYHLVESSPLVERFFVALLDELPEQAHLLVASRTIPPFPMIPLVARQQIAGLGEEHLRFTPVEVQALFQLQNRISMSTSEAETLAAHTEGWITGILLTAQLMWQNLAATWLRARQTGEPVYDYLADEVLAGLPEPLREFLLEAAVLPEMEAEMCNAILDRNDSAEMLQLAEAQRLFITGVGESTRTFRYHHLFREFLLKQLRESEPERLRELQHRAGRWYEAQGWPETAITFYVAAGTTARAVTVAEANARAMFYQGRHDTMRGWGEQLAALAEQLPTLHLHLAKVYTDAGDFVAATRALEVAEAGYRRRGDERGRLDIAVHRSLVLYRQGQYHLALNLAVETATRAEAEGHHQLAGNAWRYAGLAQFALGDLFNALESLQKSVRLAEQGQSEFDLAWALHDLSRVQRAAGQTAQAALAQRQALTIWRARGNTGPLAAALNNIGWDHHMLGQYEAALATYTEALDHARQVGLALVEILVLAGRGDLLADLGEVRQAGEAYRRALQLAETAREVGLVRYLYLAFARLERFSGNYIAAMEWLRRAELVPVATQAESVGVSPQVLRGVILLEMGEVAEGRDVLAAACAALEAAGAKADLAHGLFCLARAQYQLGNAAEAFASVQQAFTLAQSVGYDQMLVSEALPAQDLLRATQQASAIAARAAALLARAQMARKVLERVAAAPLAEPRQASLELLALGGSRVLLKGDEIARSEWGSQLPRELLFFVADRMPVDRETLLQTFWPQMSAARATANFHQTLYRVRRALKSEAIVFQDNQYRLAPQLNFDYDVANFEREARAALALSSDDLRRLPLLEAAIGRYTGEYLADLPVEWAQERRRALSDLLVDLLREYADELIHLARYPDARQALNRALAIEPLRDDLHERMLACLGAMGRRYEVVQHYQHYRNLLQTELGLDPPRSARELYARLIR